MVELSRYNIGDTEIFDNSSILKNKLNIIDQKILSDMETILLSDSYSFFLQKIKDNNLIFGIKLIFQIHKYFLSIVILIRHPEFSSGSFLYKDVFCKKDSETSSE